MSSLHQSRARVLFDAACALGISASCVGAWMQTYSNAFLPMAGIAGLFGLVRALDLAHRDPAVAEAITFAAPAEPDAVAEAPVATKLAPAVEAQPEPAASLDEALARVKAKPAARKSTRAKAGRAKKEPAPEAVQPAVEPLAQPEVLQPLALADPEPLAEVELPVADPEPVTELEPEPVRPEPVVVPIAGIEPAPEPAAEPVDDAEQDGDFAPAPIAPLFETDPFRVRRTAFGRKAG